MNSPINETSRKRCRSNISSTRSNRSYPAVRISTQTALGILLALLCCYAPVSLAFVDISSTPGVRFGVVVLQPPQAPTSSRSILVRQRIRYAGRLGDAAAAAAAADPPFGKSYDVDAATAAAIASKKKKRHLTNKKNLIRRQPPKKPTDNTANTASTPTKNPPQDSIPQFARDITTVLAVLRSEGSDPSLPSLFRNINMPSFTNIWSQRDWDLHTSRWRYLKYFAALPTSRLLRRLAPCLAILIVWACVACWICSTQRQVGGLIARAVLPLAPLSLVSTFVAALLTLRSNQGLGRLNEGRLAFGNVVLYTRDMAQLIATVIYPRNPQLGLLAARHTCIFGWLLKDFLRHYNEDYTKPLEPYTEDICHDQDIVATMLPSSFLDVDNEIESMLASAAAKNNYNDIAFTAYDSNLLLSADATFILSQRKKPVATCTRLRQIFAHMQGEMTTSEQSRLDACAQQLNKCVMVCERIRTSPIPPLYTAHAGRLLIFYLFFLPLALRGSALMNNVGTIITTTVVGYAMLGLDEISHILEEPFRLMPLYHLAKNSMKDCADAFVNMPPPLPTVGLDEDDDMEEDEEDEDDETEEDDAGGDDYGDSNLGDDDDNDDGITSVSGVDQGETSSSSTASTTTSTTTTGRNIVPDYW